MGITYTIDKNRDVIIEVWDGEITANDLREYWINYMADPDVMKCRRTLVDLRKAIISIRGNELASLIELIVIPKLGQLKWKSALLVEAPIQMGVSRQYNVFAELYSKDEIFHDYDSALKWLLQQ
jgi:hypothetical protein